MEKLRRRRRRRPQGGNHGNRASYKKRKEEYHDIDDDGYDYETSGNSSRGHRFGSFHNYYSFNPVEERLNLLVDGGILEFVVENFLEQLASPSPTATSSQPPRTPPPLSVPSRATYNNKNNTATEETTASPVGGMDGEDDPLLSPPLPSPPTKMTAKKQLKRQKKDPDDCSRTSTTTTTRKIDGFNYLDVGCNEGNLTMAVSEQILSILTTKRKKKRKKNQNTAISSAELSIARPSADEVRIKIIAHGVDLDPVLIERANRKYSSHILQSTFRVADVLLTSTPSTTANKAEPTQDLFAAGAAPPPPAAAAAAAETTTTTTNSSNRTSRTNQIQKREDFIRAAARRPFYLTSIFSTTMWIHIHGGDDGLRRVLKYLCSQTEMFLIIEPQPSKCYRSAMVRLRKMGLPELDVSTERLRLRVRIEDEIDSILNQNSFWRVVVDASDPCQGTKANNLKPEGGSDDDNDDSPRHHKGGNVEKAGKGTRTSWNRSVRLYQRFAH